MCDPNRATRPEAIAATKDVAENVVEARQFIVGLLGMYLMPGIHNSGDFKRIREMCKMERFFDFIETGTWKGETVQAALDSGEFKNVTSVELDYDLWFMAFDRFHDQATIYRGDSGIVLQYIVPDRPCFIFLDAHWWSELRSVPSTNPLPLELSYVLSRPYQDLLVIDDIQAFGGVNPRTIESDWRDITIPKILKLFKERIDQHFVDQNRLILPLRVRDDIRRDGPKIQVRG